MTRQQARSVSLGELVSAPRLLLAVVLDEAALANRGIAEGDNLEPPELLRGRGPSHAVGEGSLARLLGCLSVGDFLR